jgi:outer membrane murein-binding lipoprotein Lpp
MNKMSLGFTVALSSILLSSCESNQKQKTLENLEKEQKFYSEQAKIDQLKYKKLMTESNALDAKSKSVKNNKEKNINNLDAKAPSTTYPLKIVNNSKVQEDTYITVVDGSNIYSVSNSGELTKGPLLNKAYFQDYSKNIGNSGDFTIKLPDPFISGRIYISIAHPLGGVATNAPFYSTSSKDDNYYMSQIVYDKFELTWKGGVLYIDPTSVDFFGIPLTIQNPSPIKSTDLTESGYPLGMSWKEVIDQSKTGISNGVYSENLSTWDNLVFNSSSGSTIRIISPSGIATSSGANNSLGSTKNLANNPPVSGSSYLLNGISSTTYLQNLISYYESPTKHLLAFDVSQLYDASYPQTDIFKNVAYFTDGITSNTKCSQKINSYDSQGRPIYGDYANSSSCWKFIPKVCTNMNDLSKCRAPSGSQIVLQDEYIPMDYVSSFDFFSPGQWPFDNNNILPKVYTTSATIQNNHPAKGLIAEGLSALFSAGLLPVSNTSISNTAISKSSLNKLVNSNKSILYTENSANGKIKAKGPWFSQYSKVIHSVCYDNATKASCTESTSEKNKKYPIVYTFAFDDFLAQDGTLTSKTTTSGSSISVTINNMQGYPQTDPGKAPRPSINVDTPTVISGSLLSCKTTADTSKDCKLSATFTTKNTPDEIKSYSIQLSPISTNNGTNCQYFKGKKWTPCGGINPSNIQTISVVKKSGPDTNGKYTYDITSSVPRDSFEKIVTGAVWKNCSGSTTENKFKYYVTVSDKPQTIGALSTNIDTYHSISGCASPS